MASKATKRGSARSAAKIVHPVGGTRPPAHADGGSASQLFPFCAALSAAPGRASKKWLRTLFATPAKLLFTPAPTARLLIRRHLESAASQRFPTLLRRPSPMNARLSKPSGRRSSAVTTCPPRKPAPPSTRCSSSDSQVAGSGVWLSPTTRPDCGPPSWPGRATRRRGLGAALESHHGAVRCRRRWR